MEIEAKFRVADTDTFVALFHAQQVGPFALAPADVQIQRNTYFDTSDQRLRAAHHGLRIRDLGDRRIATLKGGGSVVDELHQREEWETEIGADDRPESWPAGELRDRVLALLDGAPLQPMLSVSTHRQHIYASRDGVVIAELALDEGTIHAAGREEAFRELEIELKDGGTRADFDLLVNLLRGQFPLIPEAQSKLARGMALLDGAGDTG